MSNTNLFSNFQMLYFRIFNRNITREQFGQMCNYCIENSEKTNCYSYEKRRDLIEYIRNTCQAIINNDPIKYEKARKKK